MLASVVSAVLDGVDGRVVSVEVHVSNGLPGYTVVGLPDAAGRESRERVRAAPSSSGLGYPMKRVTVNLAPASVRKAGNPASRLAVALGLTCADGGLRAASSTASAACSARARPRRRGASGRGHDRAGRRRGALERRLLSSMPVGQGAAEAAHRPRCARARRACIGELHACLKGEAAWPDPPDPEPEPPDGRSRPDNSTSPCDVLGLSNARIASRPRPLVATTCSSSGRPASARPMLARRLSTIMPPLEHDAALEVTRIHSAAGRGAISALQRTPPFRAPHHTASSVSLVGGGSPRVRPGEITLAHRGALFLDELPEFPISVLEGLRQPLEERVVRISRASGTLEFPADFLLVACANPCPCGRKARECRCGEAQRMRYARRLSAPLLDRFDLRLRIDVRA